ncbi:hypothetical protein CVT26_011716 [Gymnopilus dilepis]|uniref:Uncharacterized protein n=1 Tax=Gymnopilus dilepis TaxID=231916 RepID=A0A409X6N8_9AGAR|nr:hypothetical protein CVT26_011716 [Gymnopilus dilepis]
MRLLTFSRDISTLSRVSGTEHDQTCRILLGLVIDIPLENGSSPNRVVGCVRDLFDFFTLSTRIQHWSY